MLGKILRPIAFATGLLLGLAPTGFAAMQMDLPHYASVDAKGSSGKSRAAAKARAKHGGKVLSVSESSHNGQKVYRVKLLLDSGRVKIVTIKGN